MNPHRQLLQRSDALFDQVENALVRRHRRINDELRQRLEELAGEAEFAPPLPSSVARVHDWLFRLQGKMMRARPGEAAEGHYYRTNTLGWAELSLPRPFHPDDPDWITRARLVLERAYDRWDYARHHAAQKARRGLAGRHYAAKCMAVAWVNYLELKQQLEVLLNEEAA